MAILQQELSPYNAPNYDVFSPARVKDSLGVVLGAPLDGAQSYTPWIGLSTVRELALKHADKVGLVDESLAARLSDEVEALAGQLAEAEARIAELEATQERLAGLAADGYTLVKKVGRLATKKENA
jgi:hypothetical protein